MQIYLNRIISVIDITERRGAFNFPLDSILEILSKNIYLWKNSKK